MLEIPNIKKGEILAPYTTYKIGGLADYFVVVTHSSDLINAIKQARKEKSPILF